MNKINNMAIVICFCLYTNIQSHWWKLYMPASRRETVSFGIGILTGGCMLLTGQYIYKWVYKQSLIKSLQSENEALLSDKKNFEQIALNLKTENARLIEENVTLQKKVKEPHLSTTKGNEQRDINLLIDEMFDEWPVERKQRFDQDSLNITNTLKRVCIYTPHKKDTLD